MVNNVIQVNKIAKKNYLKNFSILLSQMSKSLKILNRVKILKSYRLHNLFYIINANEKIIKNI